MESEKPSSRKWKEQKEKRDRARLPLANLFKLSFLRTVASHETKDPRVHLTRPFESYAP
jgi:hypothetical protein